MTSTYVIIIALAFAFMAYIAWCAIQEWRAERAATKAGDLFSADDPCSQPRR